MTPKYKVVSIVNTTTTLSKFVHQSIAVLFFHLNLFLLFLQHKILINSVT